MRTLLTQFFAVHDVTKLRRAVTEQAGSCGLSGPRLDDFVLAVHESVVNAVQHAGGHGHFKLWTVDGVIRAETSDDGPGIPDRYVDGSRRPPDLSSTGRGIFLMRRLCDETDFRTGPGGTTVQLTMRLPRDSHQRMRRIRVSADGRSPRRFTT
ncbi:ATP-binding protein [Nonomuraea purpurea]|uniref:ATP-binding protein n=1 Tax=Nonomuraea purpurea TaxID=1849276 RepID=A0ABV8GHQ5_9ACTN